MAIKAPQAPAGLRTRLRPCCQPWNACEHMQCDLFDSSTRTSADSGAQAHEDTA